MSTPEYCQDLRCFNFLPCKVHTTDESTDRVVIQRADIRDIAAMKALQMAGLRTNISAEEATGEGFLTAIYSIELLTKMHELAPAIIAKVQDTIVGFILVAPPPLREYTEVLGTMFDAIDQHLTNGETYIGVGQLCVGKGYRGKGIATQMYQFFQKEYSPFYECLVCDVHQENVPSLRAHKKVGFERLSTVSFQASPWELLVWRWRT